MSGFSVESFEHLIWKKYASKSMSHRCIFDKTLLTINFFVLNRDNPAFVVLTQNAVLFLRVDPDLHGTLGHYHHIFQIPNRLKKQKLSIGQIHFSLRPATPCLRYVYKTNKTRTILNRLIVSPSRDVCSTCKGIITSPTRHTKRYGVL